LMEVFHPPRSWNELWWKNCVIYTTQTGVVIGINSVNCPTITGF
jgi:hypothetical protein